MAPLEFVYLSSLDVCWNVRYALRDGQIRVAAWSAFGCYRFACTASLGIPGVGISLLSLTLWCCLRSAHSFRCRPPCCSSSDVLTILVCVVVIDCNCLLNSLRLQFDLSVCRHPSCCDRCTVCCCLASLFVPVLVVRLVAVWLFRLLESLRWACRDVVAAFRSFLPLWWNFVVFCSSFCDTLVIPLVL